MRVCRTLLGEEFEVSLLGVGLMGSMLNYRCTWKSPVLTSFEPSRPLGKSAGKSTELAEESGLSLHAEVYRIS